MENTPEKNTPTRPAANRPLIQQFRVHLVIGALVVVFLGLATLLKPHTPHALWISGGVTVILFGLFFWWTELRKRS
jgi:hypothetical protein